MSDDFAEARDELDSALPTWWQHKVPGSELDNVLAVLAVLADQLGASLTQVYDDRFIATASDDALRTEWGPLFGATREDLDDNAGNLRGYLQQLAADDGSLKALENILIGLLSTPSNLALGGPPTRGLHFPSDGSGLHFPSDGSGLHFPANGWIAVIEHPSTHQLEVQVRGDLTFDRDAFARAVARARMADDLPPTITEV